MSKHIRVHLLLFIALLWTKPLEVASIQIIPPLNDVRDCSKPADTEISFSAGIAIAQKVRLITDGVLAVAGVWSIYRPTWWSCSPYCSVCDEFQTIRR